MVGYEYEQVGSCDTCGRPIVSPRSWNYLPYGFSAARKRVNHINKGVKQDRPIIRTCLHTPGKPVHHSDDGNTTNFVKLVKKPMQSK
jgi:hypothetical protein